MGGDEAAVMPRPKKYPVELVQRGIRLALESERPIAHIAADLGMHPETLRKRVRQHEADSGKRPDLSTRTERGEPLHRSASWPLRRRADLPDLGRVGVRLLPPHDRRSERAGGRG